MISRILKFSSGVLLFFATVASIAELKVGVVDVQRAIFGTEEAQAELEVMEQKFTPEQDRLKEIQDELNALRERGNKDAEIMSDDEKADLQRELTNLSRDLEYGVQRLQENLNGEREQLLQKMAPKFNAVLQDLIEVEGYDFVENFNPQVHLYVNPKHDITRRVTEKLNERGSTVPVVTSE